jgi:hypothetical protein
MLRREQPKSCIRRVKSPEQALFAEATAAIQPGVTSETLLDADDAVSPTLDVPLTSNGGSNNITEEVFRDFLRRSDQAFDQTNVFHANDPFAIMPSISGLVASAFNAHGSFPALEATSSDIVDLDGLDVSLADAQAANWEQDDEDQEDEQMVVRSSLSTWRKKVANEPKTLVDVTTFLIDHWFRDVCPQWSAFDSNLNPNRVHMSRIWTSSKAVLHSMKTMAATCLMSTLPHLKEEAMTSARISVSAIGEDLGALKLKSPAQGKLSMPIELCLALLCVGTTMCWLDTNLLGLAYWKEARRIRDYFNENYWLLDEEEQQKLAFFENSCVYWDMLCSVVSNESLDIPPSEDAILGCSPPTSLIQPHPWTGVAYKQQRLLSRTIALCRRHRLRLRKAKSKSSDVDPEPAAEDLMDAYLLSNELETIEVPPANSVLDMGDKLSLPFHFSQLAMAFRVASLLQLHQTFRLDMSAYHTSEMEAASSQRRLVLKLSLELCSLLDDIPVASNTRCTMPILYITAASGLRFEKPPSKNDPFSLTAEVLEVHRARSFILDRFASLQRSLPPKPIIVATELVQAVWREYESEKEGDELGVHWIDVMVDRRLSTLFG